MYSSSSENVKVDQMKPIVLGQVNSFCLDASEAGRGALDLSVGPPGRTLPHQIKEIQPQQYLIEFVPEEPVDHEVIILFNDVHISGSPFILPAPHVDISSVIVSGDGLVMGKVNQQVLFNINATRIPPTIQPVVDILGPYGMVPANVLPTDHSQYRVTWTPTHAGDHTVKVTMLGRQVPRSPFKVKVADPKQVLVDSPSSASLGQTANVKVDVGKAGLGKLVVIISVDGMNVPNTVHQDGQSQYRFSFKPTIAKQHDITVQFNGENVNGSPFACMVSGGSRNVMLTDHQTRHYYGNPVEIEIDARSAGEGQIVAEVRSSTSGVPSDLVPTPTKKVYSLSFIPKEGGEHTVTVTFNDEPVPQSPLKVYVQGGPVLQDEVDTVHQRTESMSLQQRPQPHQQTVKETIYHQEMAQAPPLHQITKEQSVYASDQPLLTSPHSNTIQRELTRTITYQPQYESAMVDEPTYFEINPHGLPESDLDVKLEDPSSNLLPLRTSRHSNKYRYEFTPRVAGKHRVYVDINGSALPGSPFVYHVQPNSAVRVTDVTEEGDVGEEMYFIVDASAAGSGDLEAKVSCNGQFVKIRRQPLGQSQYRYTYIPKQEGEHIIDVLYNYEQVPGCPIRTYVNDSHTRSLDRSSSVYGVQGVSGRGIQSVPVSQQAYFFIDMHGRNWKLSDVEVEVQGFPCDPDKAASIDDSLGSLSDSGGAPNGQPVPCKLFLESPNEIRVEYQTPYVGRHLVDIYCKGQKVAGSPYTVEVFDPKKVGLESMSKESILHEETEFEVCDDNQVVNDEAGTADIECKVISPSGRIIPSRVVSTEKGMKVKYTPEEPGVYYVHTYMGGVEIPGSPMTQVVRANTTGSRHSRQEYREERRGSQRYPGSDDGYGKITVRGDGLYRAEEDRPAHFFIDTHGMEGTPEVRVEGPHSVAKSSVTPEGPYCYKVTYTPVETGVYSIYICWFNQDIDGSPFHPRVVDARRVKAKGEWQSKVDSEQRVALEVGKTKTLMFDVTEAGPGELKAVVRHVSSGRSIPVTISERDAYHYYVDFVPDQAGEYLISINWTDTPIPNSPIRGYAPDRSVDLRAEAKASGQSSGAKTGKESSSMTTTKKVIKSGGGVSDNSKVVLSGTGIKEGITGQINEFYIDGSKAADGEPTVILKDSRLQHLPVTVVPHGRKCYKCTYLVNEPGSYLLFVSWADRDLLNSPYTVQMVDGSGVAEQFSANHHSSGVGTQRRSAQQKQQTNGLGHGGSNNQSAGQSSGNAGQSSGNAGQSSGNAGQTGMSKHYVRKAKMTSSNNQQQSQNVGDNFQLMIDANTMAAGELVARCIGPTMNSKCELVQRADGMYALNVRTQEPGEHQLYVTYKGEHIEGSPYVFYVKDPPLPDPTKVRVHGPGVEHGILANFQSKFYVETDGAGAGNLSVKMRGPRATMKRISQTSRTIECTYNPADVGVYIIYVQWSGVDVPGSPYHVHIFDTYYELDKFVQTGELPQTLKKQHILEIVEPAQSYPTSTYQTNTLRTLTKTKKNKKKKNGLKKGEPITLISSPVQTVQPVKYVVKEPQYKVQNVQDTNYVEAVTARPVEIVNGGGTGTGGYHQSYRRESHYNTGGSRVLEPNGTYGRSSKSKFVVDNGPQYVMRR
ncbi:filamin-A-like isoform X2 [Watersipora subatra]|uniref:filamin-A-like isoform X2 n=1 Tax=Watersipora subatra TaxID=2589382 RepID=UPI00355C4D22